MVKSGDFYTELNLFAQPPVTALCPFSSDDMTCLESFDSPVKSTRTAAELTNSASPAVSKLFENLAVDMAFSGAAAAAATISTGAPAVRMHFFAWLHRLYL